MSFFLTELISLPSVAASARDIVLSVLYCVGVAILVFICTFILEILCTSVLIFCLYF